MSTTTNDQTQRLADQQAMFGAGCFWGVEVAFGQIAGVTQTAVGYAGGQVDKPTYEQVCTDTTGHAEVVLVTFDPSQVGYEQLVESFLKLHDPTQLNRQGPDVGGQYRSAVFAKDGGQKAAARAVIDRMAASFKKPIVTTIEPWATFHRAEDYHQQYLAKRGQTSCRVQ